MLIDSLRGRPDAIVFLNAQSEIAQANTHIIVPAELLAGARDKREQTQIESFLDSFRLIVPTETDTLAALELFKTHHLSHGVDWPDCQICRHRNTPECRGSYPQHQAFRRFYQLACKTRLLTPIF